jgi:hypothetical protein
MSKWKTKLWKNLKNTLGLEVLTKVHHHLLFNGSNLKTPRSHICDAFVTIPHIMLVIPTQMFNVSSNQHGSVVQIATLHKLQYLQYIEYT